MECYYFDCSVEMANLKGDGMEMLLSKYLFQINMQIEKPFRSSRKQTNMVKTAASDEF